MIWELPWRRYPRDILLHRNVPFIQLGVLSFLKQFVVIVVIWMVCVLFKTRLYFPRRVALYRLLAKTRGLEIKTRDVPTLSQRAELSVTTWKEDEMLSKFILTTAGEDVFAPQLPVKGPLLFDLRNPFNSSFQKWLLNLSNLAGRLREVQLYCFWCHLKNPLESKNCPSFWSDTGALASVGCVCTSGWNHGYH